MDRVRLVLIPVLILAVITGIYNFFTHNDNKRPPVFFNISTKIKNLPEEKFFGITVFQYDDNPKLDLMLSGFGVSNVILKENGPFLSTATDQTLSDSIGQTKSITPCDIDGDGFNELYSSNVYYKTKSGISKSRLFKYKNNQWLDLLEFKRQSLNSFALGALCLDRNNDNIFELFVIKNDHSFEYLEYKDGKLIDVSKSIGINKSAQAKSAIVIPNHQGLPNILVGVEDGPNIFFKINKNHTFSDYTSKSGLADPLNDARGISIIDYNNDEIPDVVYGNYNGPLKLYTQNEDSSFNEVKSKKLNQNFFISSLAVSDFNLDGNQDLYINNRSGKNYLFINKNNIWDEEVLTNSIETNKVGTSIIVGDLLYNGANEILITHGHGHKSIPTLYTTKSHNKWITILPKLKSGEIARNSIVIMKTNLKSDLRVITNGSTPHSSSVPVAHFGLNNNETPVSYKLIYNGKTYSIPANKFKLGQLNTIDIWLL